MNVVEKLSPETQKLLCSVLLYLAGVVIFVIIVVSVYRFIYGEGMVAQPWVGHPDAELRALNIMNSGPGVRFYTNSAQGLGQDPGRLDYAALATQLHGLTDKEKFYLYYPYVDVPQYPEALVNDQTPYNPMAYLDGELNVV